MSPNGASQLSIHISNEVANLKREDMWHSSALSIGDASYVRFYYYYYSLSLIFSIIVPFLIQNPNRRISSYGVQLTLCNNV
ncbi:hypothetical protein Hanom_Chr12g01081631 [Helianthus anomalus]